jgi:hypothetical protein
VATHFIRLLRHAWVTVGLFLFPGHHTGKYVYYQNQIFYIRQRLEKKWEYNARAHQVFIDFKKAYDSFQRKVLYSILLEFGITKKLVRLNKMCLNETYSGVRVDEHLSDTFPVQKGILV